MYEASRLWGASRKMKHRKNSTKRNLALFPKGSYRFLLCWAINCFTAVCTVRKFTLQILLRFFLFALSDTNAEENPRLKGCTLSNRVARICSKNIAWRNWYCKLIRRKAVKFFEIDNFDGGKCISIYIASLADICIIHCGMVCVWMSRTPTKNFWFLQSTWGDRICHEQKG